MYKFDEINIENFGCVGVLYGGWSDERSVSLQSGACMINACKGMGLDVRGFELSTASDVFELGSQGIDVFLIGLHGGAGEDGHVQAALDLMGLSYVGSGMHSSSLCMNKVSSRLACKAVGIPVVPWQAFNTNKIPEMLDFEFPMCLKPVSGGSSIGVRKLNSYEEWKSCVKDLVPGWWMLEPWFYGTDHFVGILGKQALPVLEVQLPHGEFFDFNNKYSQEALRKDIFIVNRNLQEWTEKAFEVLKCEDYARADFVTIGDRSWFLEMNTLPGMAPTCLLPRQAKHAGLDYEMLILQLLASKFSEDLLCL